MKNEIKVGDKIIVSNPLIRRNGEEGIVQRVFDSGEEDNQTPNRDPHVWVSNNEGVLFWVKNTSCRVVSRNTADDKCVCPDCGGKGEIELFISTVKCKCCGGQ
jgi:hypothetical protein